MHPMNRRARRAAARGAKHGRQSPTGRHGHRRITTAALLAVFCAGASAYGDTFTWDGDSGVDSNWNTAGNWTAGSGTPGAADVAQWSGGSTPSPSTVNLSQSEAAGNLDISNKAVTFNLNNFDLAVGSTTSDIDGNNGDVIFNGPGSVSFGGLLRLGFDAGEPALHTHVTAQGGAQVTTSDGMNLGDYRGGTIISVDGEATVWNSFGQVQFGRTSSNYRTFTQPRTQLLITNGGVFNHDTSGGSSGGVFDVSSVDDTESLISIDGEGSQFNFVGDYGDNIKIGGYSSDTNWQITNGGVLSSTEKYGLSFRNGTSVNTFTITGEGSSMIAPYMTLAGRSASDATRGDTVVNVGVGGTFETTDSDGADIAVAIGDRGLLSLQGGTVAMVAGKTVTLLDAGVSGEQATLEGFGTVTGGSIVVEGDSILRPGLSTGTMTVQDGDLDVLSETAQLQWELSTDDGSHDLLELLATGSTANIAGVLNFTNLGAGVSEFGIIDFLIADLINYNTVAGAVSSGDIALNTDNLDSVMSAAGYTRVFDTPDATGEYRYLIATDAYGDLDALRLETIPEPASLALLGVGGLALLRRRAHA